jgi:hypothetical protein
LSAGFGFGNASAWDDNVSSGFIRGVIDDVPNKTNTSELDGSHEK